MSIHLNVRLSVERPKNSPKCPSLYGEAGRGEENFEFPNVLCKRKMWFPSTKSSGTVHFPRLRRATFCSGLRGDPAWRSVGDRLGRGPSEDEFIRKFEKEKLNLLMYESDVDLDSDDGFEF